MNIRLESGSYTNTFKHNILYSLRQNKFIRGRAHKGAAWGVDYRILSGYYVLWSARGFKDLRGFTKAGEDKGLQGREGERGQGAHGDSL